MTINIVLTGPPSAGKTTTFQNLKKKIKNVNFCKEISREIIKESLETGSDILPWKNAQEFDRRVVSSRNKDYLNQKNLLETRQGLKIKIYDRSPIDTYAYSKKFECIETNTVKICKSLHYDLIFFFPFEKEIYTQDDERKESIQLAIDLEKHLMESYIEFDNELITVNFDTIENRSNFIIQEIEGRLNLELDR
ncbi:ATP-binding protein [bacterium]|jgi:predicted ATPase|nr:ATP-binding protein [bacterium]MBT6293586.1 ATP-binding protein [bacterium]